MLAGSLIDKAPYAPGVGVGLGAIFLRQQTGFATLQFDRPHQFDMTRFVFGHSHSVAALFKAAISDVPNGRQLSFSMLSD